MLIEEIKDTSAVLAFAALRRLSLPFILSGSEAWKRRYSYAAADPLITIKTEAGVTTVLGSSSQKDARSEQSFKDPFEAIAAILEDMREGGDSPFPFCGGAVGYLAYDLKNIVEPRLAPARKDYTGIPECVVGIYDTVFVYDHLDKRGYLLSSCGSERRFKEIMNRLKDHAATGASSPLLSCGALTSNMTLKDYLRMIRRAEGYISAGDIYQINLSQRLTTPVQGDPFGLFIRLGETHPAPFASYMDFGSFQIISNSPERLIRIKNGIIETMPIKGTRPRGLTPEQDRMMIEELKQSRKERAEHVMIVDLERSDIGKVSTTGSVEVSAFEAIETYEHLHHMVSTVRGRLKPGFSPMAALKACFPGGSVTGTPKIRAMELIDLLEPCGRGIYTGGIGWMGINGEMDVSMAIRTAVVKDGLLRLHVGGGIVADSIPEDEYRETLLKAQDFMAAIGITDVKVA